MTRKIVKHSKILNVISVKAKQFYLGLDLNKKYREVWRDFNIKSVPNNNLQLKQNSNVKYLEIHSNDLLKYNNHIKIATKRAKKPYSDAKSLFHSTHSNSQVKIVSYMFLVRPILTYEGYIWYNKSSSIMEKFLNQITKDTIQTKNCMTMPLYRASISLY